MIKLTDILFEGKLSKSEIKKMRDKYDKTGKLPPHLQKLADLMKKNKKMTDVVVPGLEWMAEGINVRKWIKAIEKGKDVVVYDKKGKRYNLQGGNNKEVQVTDHWEDAGRRNIHPEKTWQTLPLSKVKKIVAEGKLTERKAQQARNWLDAVKLSRKGAGRKLQYKDKNGNPIYGNTQFYFQKVLHQVYPDDERTAYVAYNKKRNKVRSLNNFFTSDWKKIQIATG